MTAAVAAHPTYSYPMAQRAAYPTTGQSRLPQVAVAGGLLVILAIVTIAVSAYAVSRFSGGTHSTCTSNCAPKIITPLPEGATYHSSAFNYQVSYSSRWKLRSQDANGVVLGTAVGTLQFTGARGGRPADLLQSTVSSLPTGTWQNVTLVTTLKGAHLGDQDGIGAVYSANLVGSSSTATPVRFAVVVASKNGVSVVMFAVNPADPKGAPNGMPEGQELDYVCTEFAWS